MVRLRLGTRGSELARTQSGWVADALAEAAGVSVELEIIRTRGDATLDRPLSEIGGKGLFTAELDRALIEGEIDLAVHSLKDLPTELDPRLEVAAVPLREDPRDALVGPEGTGPVTLAELPAGARLGTSSLRRRALALAFRPDLEIREVRGNIDTRLAKLDRGEYDALLLAGAGLRRLGLSHRIHEWRNGGAWLPAPAQGALGIVIRKGNERVAGIVRNLDDRETRLAVECERALLHALQGGCLIPLGALALPYANRIRLQSVVASPDGVQVVVADGTGPVDDARGLGEKVAERLLERGADGILAAVRSAAGAPREDA